MNQTAITISKLYAKYSNNIMDKFEQKYFALSGSRFNSTVDENATWAAYNQTVLDSSDTFITMISLNKSDSAQLNTQHEQSFIDNLIKTNSTSRVNEMFAEQFHKQLQTQLDTQQSGILGKFFRKLTANLTRIKQRYYIFFRP